jgi:predicted amidohydrolase YtcJ
METSRLTPDRIFVGGTVVTLDPNLRTAEALATFNGRIVRIGTKRQVLALAGHETQIVDLSGGSLIPGQRDNHVHLMLAALDMVEGRAKVNITTLTTIDEILAAIERRVQTTPEGEWIVTSVLYRGVLRDGRFITRYDLDAVAPRHPVFVAIDGKSIVANSHALRLASINRDTPSPTKPPEGWIVKGADGEPTGQLIAGAADRARLTWWNQLGMPPQKWNFLSFDRQTRLDGLLAVQRLYHACGIVGVRDMGASVGDLETLVEAQRRGLLKLRVDVILGLPTRYMTDEQVHDALDSYFGPQQDFGDAYLRIGGIKMVVLNNGWWAYGPERTASLIQEYNRRNWTIAIHITTGGGAGEEDAATEVVLAALERATEENAIPGRRFSIEHGFVFQDPAYFERAHRLGLTIAANPLLGYYGAIRSVEMNTALESIRIAKNPGTDPWSRTVRGWGLPLRDWLESGLVVTGGTDHPAVNYDVEQPFLGQYAAMTGETMAGVLLEGQALSRSTALKLFTINNAYASWQESITGSLELGKWADMVVVDRDVLECSTDDFRDMKVIQTYVGDELVYERGKRLNS